MSWAGIWSGGSGSVVAPSYPQLTNATTADAIRDRAIDVVEALDPEVGADVRFLRYRNEGDGDFIDWSEKNHTAALRRFQVRFDGTQPTPMVSNTDIEECVVKLTTIIAYPHNARFGRGQALDRDKAIDRDAHALAGAIGLYSRPNFSAPYPDACWFEGDTTRVPGENCDYLVMVGAFTFRRQRL